MRQINEDKLEILADILEPAGRIISDGAWAARWVNGDRIGAIREAIRGHKAEIVEILARVDGADPEEYEIDGVALFARLAAMFNRPDLKDFFTSPRRGGGGAYSGPATGSTADGGSPAGS